MVQVHNGVTNASSCENSEQPQCCYWIWVAETINKAKGEEWENVFHVIAMGTVINEIKIALLKCFK